MNAEKSSKKGMVILFVGVMIGLGIGVAACVTSMAHPSAATASTAVASHASSGPLPSLYPPPPNMVSLNPEENQQTAPNSVPQATSYQQATEYQQAPVNQTQASAPVYQSQVAPQALALHSEDGTLLMPGVNAYEVTSSPTEITAGSINPNWTVGRNGLLQNPCVDPASAHGRQTGQY